MKIAIILSGCGFKDGSEIHESVMTLLALSRRNIDYQCFAPNVVQSQVINHRTDNESSEKRNCLDEAARIARGNIKALNTYNAEQFDGLILPGGFGAASNLSDFAQKGSDCHVQPDLKQAITQTHKLKKPIGALCIAPVILAKLIPNATITLGQEKQAIQAVEKMGARHQVSNITDTVIDQNNKLVTTPCYMLNAKISQIADSADALVEDIQKLVNI